MKNSVVVLLLLLLLLFLQAPCACQGKKLKDMLRQVNPLGLILRPFGRTVDAVSDSIQQRTQQLKQLLETFNLDTLPELKEIATDFADALQSIRVGVDDQTLSAVVRLSDAFLAEAEKNREVGQELILLGYAMHHDLIRLGSLLQSESQIWNNEVALWRKLLHSAFNMMLLGVIFGILLMTLRDQSNLGPTLWGLAIRSSFLMAFTFFVYLLLLWLDAETELPEFASALVVSFFIASWIGLLVHRIFSSASSSSSSSGSSGGWGLGTQTVRPYLLPVLITCVLLFVVFSVRDLHQQTEGLKALVDANAAIAQKEHQHLRQLVDNLTSALRSQQDVIDQLKAFSKGTGWAFNVSEPGETGANATDGGGALFLTFNSVPLVRFSMKEGDDRVRIYQRPQEPGLPQAAANNGTSFFYFNSEGHHGHWPPLPHPCQVITEIGPDWTKASCPSGLTLMGGGCSSDRPYMVQYNGFVSSDTYQCGGHGGTKHVFLLCCNMSALH